ncbi:hypothetical protein D3C86_1695980 [compost metagenome]
MKIRTNEIMGNETVTAVEYRDNYLGLNEVDVNVSFYPNPVINELHVSMAEPAESFVIVDRSGRICDRIPGASKELVLDVSQLASGSYTLVILFSKGSTSVQFVK